MRSYWICCFLFIVQYVALCLYAALCFCSLNWLLLCGLLCAVNFCWSPPSIWMSSWWCCAWYQNKESKARSSICQTPVAFVCSLSAPCSVATRQWPRKQNTNQRSCQEKKLGYFCYQDCLGLHGIQVAESSKTCLPSVTAIMRLCISLMQLHLKLRELLDEANCLVSLLKCALSLVCVQNTPRPSSVRHPRPTELAVPQRSREHNSTARYFFSTGGLFTELNLSWKSLPSACRMQLSAALVADLFKRPFLKAR